MVSTFPRTFSFQHSRSWPVFGSHIPCCMVHGACQAWRGAEGQWVAWALGSWLRTGVVPGTRRRQPEVWTWPGLSWLLCNREHCFCPLCTVWTGKSMVGWSCCLFGGFLGNPWVHPPDQHTEHFWGFLTSTKGTNEEGVKTRKEAHDLRQFSVVSHIH